MSYMGTDPGDLTNDDTYGRTTARDLDLQQIDEREALGDESGPNEGIDELDALTAQLRLSVAMAAIDRRLRKLEAKTLDERIRNLEKRVTEQRQWAVDNHLNGYPV